MSLPLLSVGLVAGFIRLRQTHGAIDALMATTLLTWLLYAFLVARVRAAGAARSSRSPGFALVARSYESCSPGATFEALARRLSHHVAPVELRERVALSARAGSVARAHALGDAVAAFHLQPHRALPRRR